MSLRLTILICTHNRRALLARTLASIERMRRPTGWDLDILVMANACTDGTHEWLKEYARAAQVEGRLPLRWEAVPRTGKSHALNAAIPLLDATLVAFVDDDHRVDEGYAQAVCACAQAHPEAHLFCGRILPDWDGREPAWIHDQGPYRIYPLPVPRFDLGDREMDLAAGDATPGGGNLALRPEVFATIGGFSTELGPQGHNLAGGEDTDFVQRARAAGLGLRYCPGMIQHHYVDTARLRLGYIMRKAYQRSRAGTRSGERHEGLPRYLWRKVAGYGIRALIALSPRRKRYYLVRTAAALGEMKGIREQVRSRRVRVAVPRWPWWLVGAGLAFALPPLGRPGFAWGLVDDIAFALAPATLLCLLLMAKSLHDYSRTGPHLGEEIVRTYRGYTLYALTRLGFWAWILLAGMGLWGTGLAWLTGIWTGTAPSPWQIGGAASAGILVLTSSLFLNKLLYLPAAITASSHYLPSRFYGLWDLLSPVRLKWLNATLWGLTALSLGLASAALWRHGDWAGLSLTWGLASFSAGLLLLMWWDPEPAPEAAQARTDGRPNILMIGADTLRADRVGGGYPRPLTPVLDRLAAAGVSFEQCYVPCARTAPSLVSLLTGTWPQRHGVRDNYIPDHQTRLEVDALPRFLGRQGYRTAALSDWCGADLGKFDFGFDHRDLPADQWNLKYFIRQGPKDIRLFLSLFAHGPFGKRFLPEIHYLGGIPLTPELGRQCRRLLNALGRDTRPFLLNCFIGTTHPPFGSDYPWYLRYADPGYKGESKFVMARLTDPFEIIRRQGEPREEFDLDQIIDLYDGCVSAFDAEVGKILDHLEATGLSESTLVVVYSDHGMEFFEHGTWGQGNSILGDHSQRIPLILRDPRQAHAIHRVDARVRSVDLMPTLLEWVGLPVPATGDGRSLCGLMEGRETGNARVIYNETGIWVTEIPGQSPDHLRYPDLLHILDVPDHASGTLAIKPEFIPVVTRAKDRMILRNRWKLVFQAMARTARLSLYDIEDDPECTRDLLHEHPDVACALWQELLPFLEADGGPARVRLPTGCAARPATAEDETHRA